jgi:hypothetical protein
MGSQQQWHGVRSPVGSDNVTLCSGEITDTKKKQHSEGLGLSVIGQILYSTTND